MADLLKQNKDRDKQEQQQQVVNTPYGPYNPNAYSDWLESQYGAQAFGQPKVGGKNRPPEPVMFQPQPVMFQPQPVQEFPYQDPMQYYNNYLQDTYGVQAFGQGEQQQQHPDIWYDPFGDPLGGEEVSMVPQRPGKRNWTSEDTARFWEAYYGMQNLDTSYNVGVQETQETPAYSGYGYPYYANYYPQYRYGNSEQVKNWYMGMLQWQIS